MSELKSIFDKYTTLSHTALLATASRSMKTALSHLRRIKPGNENELLSAIVAAALGADGRLSEEEIDFMGELFSSTLTKEKLSALTERFETEKMRAATDRVVDSMDKDGKRAICTLCLCILASDKAIAPEENAFLLRLIQ